MTPLPPDDPDSLRPLAMSAALTVLTLVWLAATHLL